jgi:hypothetical protein
VGWGVVPQRLTHLQQVVQLGGARDGVLLLLGEQSLRHSSGTSQITSHYNRCTVLHTARHMPNLCSFPKAKKIRLRLCLAWPVLSDWCATYLEGLLGAVAHLARTTQTQLCAPHNGNGTTRDSE